MREIVPSADPSITRFGGFNLFAQQLQSKPLVLGCRQPVARDRERLRYRIESCPITRVEIRVGQNRSMLGRASSSSLRAQREMRRRRVLICAFSEGRWLLPALLPCGEPISVATGKFV